MKRRTRWLTAAAGALVLAAGAWWWHDDHTTRFLPADTTAFVTGFAAPPAADSRETRRELEQLLAIQDARTPADESAAQADRRTEVRRFYGALGFDPDVKLPRIEALAGRVEDDVGIYVGAVKRHYRRLRPYVIEPRLEPCITNVRDNLSYPSGHSAFGWSMAYLLSMIAPEHGPALERRAGEYGRQRMVCGVHFASDVAAGRQAARWVLDETAKYPEFRAQLDQARREYRNALAAQRGVPAN